MARKAFFSFHYDADNWRVSQVRNIHVVEENRVLSSNEWEQVKKGGDTAIQRWIDGEMYGKSCVIVLVGTGTANRKWINYEISRGWNDGKGVVGVRINGLKIASEIRLSQERILLIMLRLQIHRLNCLQ